MVHPELHEWVALIFWDSESNQMVAKHTLPTVCITTCIKGPCPITGILKSSFSVILCYMSLVDVALS